MSEKVFVTSRGDVLVSIGKNEEGDYGVNFSGENFENNTISAFLTVDGMTLERAQNMFDKVSQENAQGFADEYFGKTLMQIVKGE